MPKEGWCWRTAENIGCEGAETLRECWGKWAPLLPAGEGWTGQCLGAWLLHGRRSRVSLDVRNVTRLVCFPSLTNRPVMLITAGHLQGSVRWTHTAVRALLRAGQG